MRPNATSTSRIFQSLPWVPIICRASCPGNRLSERAGGSLRDRPFKKLAAPASVEFFSREGERLGDKRSVGRCISEITGIPAKALQGSPLSDFSIAERLSWQNSRETIRKEDKAYLLLGIFGIHMPLIYGEGRENAFKRLREEIYRASKGESFSLNH